MSHHIAYQQKKQTLVQNIATIEISVDLDIEDVIDNIAGKVDCNIISNEGEEGQERTPEMSTCKDILENLLYLCYIV